MQSDGGQETQPALRLHPLSLLFSIGSLAKSLLLPGMIVLVWGLRGGYEAWFMILFVPAVVSALFKYLTYRYRFDPDELVIREGLIFRNERHVPYARIQNIDLAQNPLHRLFSVAEVRLETAGGEKPEAVMRVLSLSAVQEMRSCVFERTGSADADLAPLSDALHVMSLREVVLFGLISNKGMVVVAAALGLAWQLDLLDWEDSRIFRDPLRSLGGLLPSGDWLTTGLLVLGALFVLLVLMRILSVAWAMGKFYGFRLMRRGDDLVAEHGLLTRRTKTIPRHRIQVLSTREGFLHRRCGRVAVQVETAGGGQEAGSSADRLWLAPLMRKAQVPALLRDVLPEVDVDAIDWRSISPRARRRRLRRASYLALLLTAIAVAAAGWPGLVLPLVLAPLAWLNATLYVRHTAYALVPGAIFFRSGWWNRRVSVARFSKIQSLERAESPFDRRHGMASVRVDTAGSNPIAHSIDVPYLDSAVASALVRQLYDEARRTDFRW